MKILFNLATLKKGGGQNVALNFLESLFRTQNDFSDYYFTCVRNTEIHYFLTQKNVKTIIFMPSSPIKRILKEFFLGSLLLKKYKIEIIYSYFGIGIYPAKYPQISGSADSNLFFPEVNFWKDYKGLNLLKKKLIDKYRIWGMKKMKAVIFENKILEERSKTLFNLKNTIFIKPSINLNYLESNYKLDEKIEKEVPKGLFLCGWHKNKNYKIIPKIAAELKKQNIDFHFILTANKDNSQEYIEFKELCSNLNVTEMISVVGSVKKNEIKSLYSQINFVFLLSKLESFSNNIIEAWHYKKPLIISDELWAKSICKDAAIYVNRDNEIEISKVITNYLINSNDIDNLILSGEKILGEYPNIDTRTKEELNYIKYIYELS